MKSFPELDEAVLCVVDRILGTTVFVKIEAYGKEGVIATSEVAPGRIRNIRDYVVPGKRIVCKVLRIDEKTGHIDLSLRRVSSKERGEILEIYEREKNAMAILKVVAKDKSEQLKEKILKENSRISDFLSNADASKLLAVGFSKEESEAILKILKEKPRKKIAIKVKISMSSEQGDGVIRIMNVLTRVEKEVSGAEITYLSAPNLSLEVVSAEGKEARKNLDLAKKLIIDYSKSNGVKASISE